MTSAWIRLAAAALLALAAGAGAQTVDMGQSVPDAKTIEEGLFPKAETECEQLQGAGFKCMGFRPTVRYSLPASSFRLGSAELPSTLRQQLEVFAEVLKAKKGSDKVIRIEGHADKSGSAAGNQTLSQRRAEAVTRFLVERGADPAMLSAVGKGANEPKNSGDPFAAENRRVEIGRAQ